MAPTSQKGPDFASADLADFSTQYVQVQKAQHTHTETHTPTHRYIKVVTIFTWMLHH